MQPTCKVLHPGAQALVTEMADCFVLDCCLTEDKVDLDLEALAQLDKWHFLKCPCFVNVFMPAHVCGKGDWVTCGPDALRFNQLPHL